MSSSYTYDSSGQSYFFVLTVMLFVLLPCSYLAVERSTDRSHTFTKPLVQWNAKSEAVKRTAKKPSRFRWRYLVLAIAWALFAVVVHQARQVKSEASLYDPFEILGLSTSATEKEIKKHYKRLSLKFHPDKIQVGPDQTKEEIENHFVDITKAYKALTDEEIRKNYELYGHPDGKQEFQQGIALPSWMVEEHYRWIVIALYALGLGVVLPYLVSRWWSKSRSYTKDKILLSTSSILFQSVKESTDYGEMMDIIASAIEFRDDQRLLELRKKLSAAGADEYTKLVDTVLGGVDGKIKNAFVEFDDWPKYQQRARILTSVYLLRLPVQDEVLLKEMYVTVELALGVASSFAAMIATMGFLQPYLCALHVQQYLTQALHPSQSQLLQLPDIDAEKAAALHAKKLENIISFAKYSTEPSLALQVARNLPRLVPVAIKLGVRGEKLVMPGSLIHGEITLRVVKEGEANETKEAETKADDVSETKEDDASSSGFVKVDSCHMSSVKSISVGFQEDLVFPDDEDVYELQRTPEEESKQYTLVHAPYLPVNRPTSFLVFIGDHKTRRSMMAPVRFTDTDKVEFDWQVPPNPGLYTFQLYLASENYVGLDTQIGIRMLVRPQDDIPDDDDDDISEPEEDTLAGQFALMRGGNVKRSGAHDSDDESDVDSVANSDTDTDTDTDEDD